MSPQRHRQPAAAPWHRTTSANAASSASAHTACVDQSRRTDDSLAAEMSRIWSELLGREQRRPRRRFLRARRAFAAGGADVPSRQPADPRQPAAGDAVHGADGAFAGGGLSRCGCAACPATRRRRPRPRIRGRRWCRSARDLIPTRRRCSSPMRSAATCLNYRDLAGGDAGRHAGLWIAGARPRWPHAAADPDRGHGDALCPRDPQGAADRTVLPRGRFDGRDDRLRDGAATHRGGRGGGDAGPDRYLVALRQPPARAGRASAVGMQRLRQRLRGLSPLAGVAWPSPACRAHAWPRRESASASRNCAASGEPLPHDLRYADVEATHLRAYRDYVVRPWPGKLSLFRAEEQAP